MNTSAIISLIVGGGLLWGGLGYCLSIAIRSKK